MTITKRVASAVFDRFNFTIMDVTGLSDPSPVDYSPQDFFGFYEAIFAVDPKLNESDWTLSTQYSFLLILTSFLESVKGTQINSGTGAQQLRLQEFLATPIALFNNAEIGALTPDMGNTLALAIPSYRVISVLTTLIVVGPGASNTIPIHDRRTAFVTLVGRCSRPGYG
jgi:hypothetical protein